jgi:hypothetical protein
MPITGLRMLCDPLPPPNVPAAVIPVATEAFVTFAVPEFTVNPVDEGVVVDPVVVALGLLAFPV